MTNSERSSMATRRRGRPSESFLHSWRLGGYREDGPESCNGVCNSNKMQQGSTGVMFTFSLNESKKQSTNRTKLKKHPSDPIVKTEMKDIPSSETEQLRTLCQTQVGTTTPDPFNSWAVVLSNQEYHIIHAYGLSLLRRSWPRKGGLYDLVTKQWMSECGQALSNVSAAHSLMALTSTWASVQMTGSRQRAKGLTTVYRHQAKALPALHQNLGDPKLTQANAMAVAFIAGSLLMVGQPADAVVHLTFLKTLLAPSPDLSSIPLVLRHQIVAIDVISSGALNTKPLFPCPNSSLDAMLAILNPSEHSDVVLFLNSLTPFPNSLPLDLDKTLETHYGLLALKMLVEKKHADPTRQMELLYRVNTIRWSQMSLIQQRRHELSVWSGNKSPDDSTDHFNDSRDRSYLALDLCFRICLLHLNWLLGSPSVSELTVLGDFEDLGTYLYDKGLREVCQDIIYFWLLGAASIIEQVLRSRIDTQRHAPVFLHEAVGMGISNSDELCEQMRKILPLNSTIRGILSELWSKREEPEFAVCSGEGCFQERLSQQPAHNPNRQRSFVLNVGGAKSRFLLAKNGAESSDHRGDLWSSVNGWMKE